VAKLVDAVDSKSSSSNRVLVRVRSPAKTKRKSREAFSLFFYLLIYGGEVKADVFRLEKPAEPAFRAKTRRFGSHR
jgi:hypothetical protein